MALALLLLTTGTPDHLRLVTGDALLLVSSGPPELQGPHDLPRAVRRTPMPLDGQVPVLDALPMPGDLATTVVAGSLPCAILPSGMTPGDDTDG